VIRLENLSKSFGRAKALDGLSLSIAAGEKVALVGSNGAGKTTLFRCLLGQYVHSGVARVAGRDPRRDRTEVLKLIGFVPQLPPPLKMPVEDLIAFATGVSGANAGSIAEVAGALGLDLTEIAGRPFVKLSGGQKQKLLIAIALGRDARFLILDEPAANLDPAARAALFELLGRRRDDTMLISSHRIDEVAGLGTRIVELDRGRVVYDEALVATAGAGRPMQVGLRVIRVDPAFAKAMHEWGFVANDGGLAWDGAVAGPDRLKFFNLLSRYAGLIGDASIGADVEKGARHESLHRRA
jgi:ABC-2 type transport system ATP-binding protein